MMLLVIFTYILFAFSLLFMEVVLIAEVFDTTKYKWLKIILFTIVTIILIIMIHNFKFRLLWL